MILVLYSFGRCHHPTEETLKKTASLIDVAR